MFGRYVHRTDMFVCNVTSRGDVVELAFCVGVGIFRSCGPCQHITGTKAVAYLYDANLNVAGYVANDNGQAVLAFRGTVPSSLQVRLGRCEFARIPVEILALSPLFWIVSLVFLMIVWADV